MRISDWISDVGSSDLQLATRLGHIDSEPRQPAPTRASVAATAAAAKAGRKCSTDLIGYLRLAIVPPRNALALRTRRSLFQALGPAARAPIELLYRVLRLIACARFPPPRMLTRNKVGLGKRVSVGL